MEEGRLLLKYLLISALTTHLTLKKKLSLKKEIDVVWCYYCQCDPIVHVYYYHECEYYSSCFRSTGTDNAINLLAFSMELLKWCRMYLWTPLSF